MSEADRFSITSPKGKSYIVDSSDPTAVSVLDISGRRLLRVSLKGITARAMIKRIRANIETGAPAYLAAWPPKDVDMILTSHAIACER